MTATEDLERLARVAARVIRERFDVPASATSIEQIEPWCVARVHLDVGSGGASADEVPRSVIVKWIRDDPSGRRSDPAQAGAERASLVFLESRGLDVAPRWLGSDDGTASVVIEDLLDHVPLAELLRARDPAATDGLVAFATTLGSLHAATAGSAGEFAALHRLGPADLERARRWVLGGGWNWELVDLAQLGVAATPGTQVEMERVRRALLDEGPFTALSNGDAGANNAMVSLAGTRIIDWEHGGFRHALLDAVCLHVPSPIWVSVADPVPLGVADAYRRALAAGVSAAEAEEYELALAAACTAAACERLLRVPLLDARAPGHTSRPQLVATVEAAARCIRAVGSPLPALAGWLEDVAAALRRRWPDADVVYADAYVVNG